MDGEPILAAGVPRHLIGESGKGTSAVSDLGMVAPRPIRGSLHLEVRGLSVRDVATDPLTVPNTKSEERNLWEPLWVGSFGRGA